jgi:hypothetical protein
MLVTGWGLRIDTEVAIPGALPAAPGPFDIAVRLGPARPAQGSLYERIGEGFAFTAPGVARYRIEGAAVRVTPDPGADPALVAALLVATALPALMWARGDVVLHAAAAVMPGTTRAMVVCGASGIGKSTWLARAARAGAAALADDSLRVAGDLAAAGLPAARQARRGGSRAVVPVARTCAAAPLGAIVVMEPGEGAPVRLSGIAALQALLAQRHRPAAARLLRLDGAALARLAALAAAVPIVRWPVGARRARLAP